jgi:hypothetical protein
VAHRAVVRATGVDGPGGTLGGDDERGTRTDASEYRRSGGFNFDRVSLLRGRSRVDKELTSIRIFDAHRNSDYFCRHILWLTEIEATSIGRSGPQYRPMKVN